MEMKFNNVCFGMVFESFEGFDEDDPPYKWCLQNGGIVSFRLNFNIHACSVLINRTNYGGSHHILSTRYIN